MKFSLRSILRTTLTTLMVCLVVGVPIFAFAQNDPEAPPPPVSTGGNEAFGFGAKLDKVAESYNPSSSVPVEERVGSIIAFALSFLGVIFMILIIYAGFRWMTAAGDEEQIKKATATIRAAVIGLVIVIAAYALSVFIIERLWGTV